VYDKLSVDIRNFSATQKFPFAMSLATPGGGALKVTGHAGPLNPSGIGATPMDASVDATRVDIAKAGVIDPRAGLGGIFDLHLSIASTGTRLTTTGTLRADKLQLVPGASPATRAIDVSYASEYDVERHEGAVTKGELRVGKATAQLTGRFTTREAAPVVRVTLSGRAMPVPDLEALLPAIGATLPRGAHFRGGTLDVGFTANGGVDRLVTAGQLVMTNATIAGFDLGTQMKAVATLAGVGRSSDTTIESLRTALRISPEGTRVDNLTCIVRSVGRLDGAGTIAPNGALDFKMVGVLAGSGGVGGQLARVASLGHPESGVPFRVTGTATSPVFTPDVGRAAAQALKDPATVAKATGFLRSVFGKKK
jgi:hypothetical protein